MENNKNIYLAILNITSWVGLSSDATHVYGHLILCENKNVNINNIEEYNVKYLGDSIEIRQPLTLELAKKLDQKDNTNSNQRALRLSENNPQLVKEDPDYATTNRFETFEEVVNAGNLKWKELNIN